MKSKVSIKGKTEDVKYDKYIIDNNKKIVRLYNNEYLGPVLDCCPIHISLVDNKGYAMSWKLPSSETNIVTVGSPKSMYKDLCEQGLIKDEEYGLDALLSMIDYMMDKQNI